MEIQILLLLLAGVSGRAQQDGPDNFQAAFNSTFLPDNNQLFKPIVIPNITFQPPQTSTAEPSSQQTLQPPQAQVPVSQENVKSNKFSARYSTKGAESGTGGGEGLGNGGVGVTEVAESERDGKEEGGDERKTFADRSDDLSDVSSSEEEKEDIEKYFGVNGPEESEVSPTTNEPYEDLASLRNDPYSEEGYNKYEATSSEEKSGSSEEESEEKRSLDDYHNADSKNYHSVQTPLTEIQYRGPHSLLTPERTRFLTPIRRRPTSHNWPYSRSHVQGKLEKENEIPESDENGLEEGIRQELRRKPGLELAVERDEIKFDRNGKYNLLEERSRGKQKVKGLVAEEEKDQRRLPLQVLRQYQVNEEPRYQPPRRTHNQRTWSTRSPLIATPRSKEVARPSTLDISEELAADFRGHQFLGPVVFKQELEQEKGRPRKEPGRSALSKVRQDEVSSGRSPKWIFGGGGSQSFNHLEESDEMYNAILANIQSVFGVRAEGGGRSSGVGVGPEESKALTWSVGPGRRPKVDEGGRGGVSARGSGK